MTVLIAALAFLLMIVGYWQFVIAEGAYLGQPVVTWLYDRAARRYDAIKQLNPEVEALVIGEPIAAAVAAVTTPLILDIGTGTGRVPVTLFGQPGFNGHIVAVDASRRMLEVAAEKLAPFNPRLTLLWRDAATLPFRAGTFDVVTMLEVLEFTPSPRAQLAEAVRVLAPGGLLVTSRRAGPDARMLPGKTHNPEAFEALLSEDLGLVKVRLMRWQFDYDLVWAIKPGLEPKESHRLEDILVCPVCDRVSLINRGESLVCSTCASRYPINDTIIQL